MVQRDYLTIEISFPGHLRAYMQQIRNELVAQNRYEEVSSVHSHGGGKWGMDVKFDIEKIHMQYPFIEYQREDGLTTIRVIMDAAAMTTLLMAPSGFLPPASLGLSEAEVIEFYSWQLANAIPPEQISRLLSAIEIAVVLQTRVPPSLDSVYWDSEKLIQLASGNAALKVKAQYR